MIKTGKYFMKTEKFKTTNNHIINVFKDDYIGRKIKKIGLYEKATLNFIRKMFKGKKGLVIFDVGANIGNHSLDFSTYADQVYSFEPLGFVFDVLKRNVEENDINNVILTNKALSVDAGMADIYVVKNNVGASGFYEKESQSEVVRVEKIVGDDFCEREGIQRIDLLKVDVEGHEDEVLRGLIGSIKKFKPVIMIEWVDQESIDKVNASSLLDELRKIYTISVLGNNKDEGYYEGKFLGIFRRRIAKMFLSQRAKLYSFDETMLYKNIILVPKSI